MVDHNTIVLLILLVFLSGFFSATETAFSSASRIRLKYLAGTGSKRAEKTLAIVDDFTTFLSTVLIGNNVVNIFSASVATVLFTQLFQENGVFLSSLVMTIVVLIFGEIIPKTIAKQIPEKFAMAVTPVMSLLIFLLKPLTAIFHLLEKTVRKFFKEEEEQVVFSEEQYFEKIDEAGNSRQWIVPTAQKYQMEPLLVQLQPRQSLEEDKPHNGEEFGYVLSGRIQLFLGDKVYSIRAGESFYYKATQRHRIANPGGRPAKYLWISTPPEF